MYTYKQAYDIGFVVLLWMVVTAVLFACYTLYKTTVARMAVKKCTYVANAANDGNESCKTCLICLDEYGEGDAIHELECKHALHETCLTGVKDHWRLLGAETPISCPICRGNIRMV